MTTSRFDALGLCPALLTALDGAGYATPTPIQAQAIPHVLAEKDLIGIAQTGTGKTAAFTLPILDLLDVYDDMAGPKGVRALVLAPTRELAIQIAETVEKFARPLGLRHATVIGGVGMAQQIKALSRGVDVLIACPGRLLDLMQGRHVRLDTVHHLVLDEADRMLDMGFVKDVTKIVAATPKDRQTLMFSATFSKEVADLARAMLVDPVRVEVTPQTVTVERIAQTVYGVPHGQKRAFLLSLLADPALSRVVAFTRTKHGANRLAEGLEKAGIVADALHGNKSQNARNRALDGFRAGTVRVLVATDIAARGIDVDGISHVINYDIPVEPEAYVHRIGRTARAGRDGIAISLCDPAERPQLKAIEKLARLSLPIEPAPGLQALPAHDAGRPAARGDHHRADAARTEAKPARPRGAAPRRRRRAAA